MTQYCLFDEGYVREYYADAQRRLNTLQMHIRY